MNNINFINSPATLKVVATGINPDTIQIVLNNGTINSISDTNSALTNNYDLSLNGPYGFTASVIIANDVNTLNDSG